MFEYLSFLRPPLESCVLNNPVILVPQIANDLRTEPCENEHNISFAWENESGVLHRGGFSKLTAWRPGGMYKPLTVTLPSEARPGDFWRLCLVVLGPDQKSPSLALDLLQSDFGRLPFPVTSLPISIVAGEGITPSGSGAPRKSASRQPNKASPNKSYRAKPRAIGQNSPTPQLNAPKQEKIERLYLLPPSSHAESESRRTLRITEQTSFDLDKKIWDSGVAVSSWLARLLSRSNDPGDSILEFGLVECLRRRLTQSNNLGRAVQIIELGAGTGIVSIVLAALFAQCISDFSRPENSNGRVRRARILATDLPSAIELIEHNRITNEHLFRSGSISLDRDSDEPQCSYHVELCGTDLDWDNPVPPSVWELEADTEVESEPRAVRAHAFDIIVMADVTYNTASFSALLDTVTTLLQGPTSSTSTVAPMILLAYKCRDPAERTLWDDALARGVSFVQVDSVEGVKEPAVEIWIGGWEKDVKSLWSNAHGDASKNV